MNVWRYTQSVAPTSEPVTRSEAKLHLRVDHEDEDTLIDDLITAARQTVERATRRQLMTATWVGRGDQFPTHGQPVYLQWPPLVSVTSISYLDLAGDSQTWSASDYQVDIYGVRGNIRPAYNESYPSTYSVANAVTITYVAGYSSAANVPKPLKQAVLLILGHLYANREATTIENIKEVPMAAQHLMAAWAVPEFR